MRTARLVAFAAVLLSLVFAGCSVLPGEVPEGCGEERRHHLDQPSSPVHHAITRTQDDVLVYLWEVQATGACKAEHVAIDVQVVIDRQHEQPDPDGDRCDPVSSVVGSAYLPGSFISARTIGMSPSGGSLYDPTTYTGSTSFGLKQAPGAEDAPASYTADVEVHYPIGGDEEWARDCVAVMVRSVEITAVDRADE